MTQVNETIRTGRLLLRPLRPSDAEPLFRQFADWEIIRWLSTPPWPYTLDDAHSFVASQMQRPPSNTGYLVITLDEAVIGGVDAGSRGPGAGAARSPTLGYWLARSYWGLGYMSEAAGAYVAQVFATTAIDTIYSGAFVGNDASLRVQDKLGFERTGEMQLYSRPHGERRPHINTQITRSQHLARIP
jgi:RimJ/RimL family protein N-acetyltransferase